MNFLMKTKKTKFHQVNFPLLKEYNTSFAVTNGLHKIVQAVFYACYSAYEKVMLARLTLELNVDEGNR